MRNQRHRSARETEDADWLPRCRATSPSASRRPRELKDHLVPQPSHFVLHEQTSHHVFYFDSLSLRYRPEADQDPQHLSGDAGVDSGYRLQYKHESSRAGGVRKGRHPSAESISGCEIKVSTHLLPSIPGRIRGLYGRTRPLRQRNHPIRSQGHAERQCARPAPVPGYLYRSTSTYRRGSRQLSHFVWFLLPLG